MKNKSFIANICLSAFSVLAIVFLALPYFGAASGFDTFKMLSYVTNMDFGEAMVFVAPLMMMIASILVLVFSVLNLLGNTKVLKSEKLLKVSRIIALVASIVLVLFALAGFVILLVYGTTPAYGLIINLVLAIATVVGTALVVAWKNK